MPNTYSWIANATATNDTNVITFSNIPQIYSDLVIKAFMRNTSGNDQAIYVLPNSSAANTDSVYLNAGTSGVIAGNLVGAGLYIGSAFNNSSTSALAFAPCEVYIGDYTGSNHKACAAYNGSAQNSTTTQYGNIIASYYKSSSAITSLQITIAGGGNIIQQYSTASLYGIRRT